MRPGDKASATVLGFEAELTRDGLLPEVPGGPVAALPPACGTAQAARRHRRRGEHPLDPDCAAAERADRAARKARGPVMDSEAPAIPATPEALGDLAEVIGLLALALTGKAPGRRANLGRAA